MYFKKLCLIFLCITQLIQAAAESSFSRTEFEEYAGKYGNKTANLRELDNLVKTINDTSNIQTRFAVPAFFGISNQEVIDYFEANKPALSYRLVKRMWENFIKSLQKNATTLSVDELNTLSNIRRRIHMLFELPDESIRPFFFNVDERQQGFIEFLNTAEKDNKLLMVRSSGREDSKALSNAGGNESVSSVDPNISALSSAMAEVIASYFSEKSIGQRLALKDPTIREFPSMPVLLQIMIGEIAGGNNRAIPISGVMFRPEAEGKTPGITTIQATWGHNEAVVNGLVPVDTFYVGTSDVIHPVVRIKPNRLVTERPSSVSSIASSSKDVAPKQQAGLVLRENPKHLREIPCLTKRYILDLNHAAQIIQRYYDDAVDIEFVILNNVIYLVQVRPIEEQKINPSYINPEALEGIDSQTIARGTSIGVGGGSVRTIENKQSILVAQNIRDALGTFLSHNDKDTIQAVVVGQMAPATSHEATIFRASNKPVLYLNDLSQIKNWVNNNTFPLLIDPQQELVVSLAALKKVKGSPIVHGWYAHPIPKLVSLFSIFIEKPDEAALQALRPQEFYKSINTTELIKKLKFAPIDEAMKALRSILARVAFAFVREEKEQAMLKEKGLETNSKIMDDLKKIFNHLFMCANEYRLILDGQHTPLERLYPITFIEALLRQVPNSQEIVNNYSFISTLKTEFIERKIALKNELSQEPLRAFITQYAKVGEYALSETIANDWNEYVNGMRMVKSDKHLQSWLPQILKSVSNLNLLPMWLNVSFATIYKNATSESDLQKRTQLITEALQNEYNASIDFVQHLEKIKQLIDGINMESWAKPELFVKQKGHFTGTILHYFISPEFIASYESSGTLGKLAAVSVMHHLVDQFDTSIKTLKGSQTYTNIDNKVANFATMLQHYYNLFQAWGNLKMPEFRNYIAMKKSEDYSQYFSFVQRQWDFVKNKKGALQLEPSGHLNIASATIGSAAMLSRAVNDNSKLTLEDIFSLIHQNLLMIINTLTKDLTKHLDYPPLLKDLQTELLTIDAFIIGIELNKDNVTLFLNKPLRDHSATMEAVYSLKNKNIVLHVHLIGFDRYGRWGKITDFVEKKRGIELIQKPHLEGESSYESSQEVFAQTLSFAWKINNSDQATGVTKWLSAIAGMTMN